MMRGVRPHAKLSAAVGPSPDEALKKHFQDSRRWIADGLLDAVYPMNYAPDLAGFQERSHAWSSMRPRAPVVMGIMFDKRRADTVLEQIRRTAATGSHFAAFAYNSLFERLDRQGRPIKDEQNASRAALRQRVFPYLRRLASLPGGHRES